MSDMVEKVARAIAKEIDCVDWTAPDNTMSHSERLNAIALDAARAAIEAMREPTEEMCDAGGAYLNGFDALGEHTAAYAARGTFEAMIDTALEGPAITIDMSPALSTKGE